MAANRITGIYSDGRTFEWAVLASSGGRFADSGRVDLPPPADGGDREAWRTEAIERIRSACGRGHGDVVLGLGSDCILLRVLNLPDVEDEDLAGMAELQADKFAPFPLESLVVSHEVVARHDGHCVVVVAAAREADIDVQGRLFAEAGLKPKRIDAGLMGTWRLLKDAGACPKDQRCIHVLPEGAVAGILLTEDGIPRLLRTLPLPLDGGPDAVAAELREELGSTLLSFELENGARQAVLTVWGAATLEPVAAALEGAGPWDATFKLRETLPDTCRGVALRGADARGLLDLTPRGWKAAAQARGRRRRVLVALAGVVASWLLLLGAMAGIHVYEKHRVAALQAERARWREPAQAVRELRRRALMIERYTDVSRSTLECLREVSRLLPPGIDLTSFSYNKDDAVRLVGQAAERNLIYRFKQALDGSDLFSSADLGGQTQDRRQRYWQFDVTLKLPGSES